MNKQFEETLYDSYRQQFDIDEIYFESQTEHQHLMIFKNTKFGRVMILDGVVQTTERDEFIYHEMMTHVPVLAHGSVKKVLVIGGGDGGCLRELVKHPSIESIVQVEIDFSVIEMSKKYLPKHSSGAFDDPRVKIIIDDGINFVSTTEEKFDIIVSDSTDPIGPGAVLFSRDFYAACKKCLSAEGLLVTQNSVPFMQIDSIKNTAKRISSSYTDCSFYGAAIPTYIGGIMTFAWATDNINLRIQSLETIKERFKLANIATKYYNPEIHVASFALPEYILNAIG